MPNEKAKTTGALSMEQQHPFWQSTFEKKFAVKNVQQISQQYFHFFVVQNVSTISKQFFHYSTKGTEVLQVLHAQPFCLGYMCALANNSSTVLLFHIKYYSQ